MYNRPDPRRAWLLWSLCALSCKTSQPGEASKQVDGKPVTEPTLAPAHPGEVYRVDINGAPMKGAKDALVTIVEFADFQCPFCARLQPAINQVMAEYAGKVRLVWRNLPQPFHDNAKAAALAAMAAHQQGKFWEMHDILLKNQNALAADKLERYAKQIGLDMAEYKGAIADKKLAAAVDADAAMGASLGVRGSPVFFINGTLLPGARSFAEFKTRIDAELQWAEAAVKKGTPAAGLYDTLMKAAKTEVGSGAEQAAPPPTASIPQPSTAGPRPDGFTITATVSNLKAAKDCFAEGAYVELVRTGPKGFGAKTRLSFECGTSCLTSIASADKGQQANGPQDRPKSAMPSDRIVLSAGSLLPGQYVILVQKWDGMKCMGRLTPIIFKRGVPLKVDIPGDAKPPFRLDLGAVDFSLQ